MADCIFVAYILAVIGYAYFSFSRKFENIRFNLYRMYLNF